MPPPADRVWSVRTRRVAVQPHTTLPQLLHGLAEVLEQLAIGNFDVAARRQQCDEPGDTVHEHARFAFALIGPPRLLAEQASLLQADRRLGRGDIQQPPSG